MEQWERLREDTDKKLSALVWFAAGMFVGILVGAFLQWSETRDAAAQDIVTKDGEPVCTNWLQFLRDHPDERPIFTGYDKDGQVIKVLAKQGGGTWRLVILAAAEEARFGCAIFQGDRFLAP